MIIPPTRVLSVTPTIGWVSNASPKTTPAFNVQAGDLLVYMAFTEDRSRPINTPTWTGSGTFTSLQSIIVNNYCAAYVQYVNVTATATGRTVSTAGSSTGAYSFVVSVWRNHGGIGVSGKANVNNNVPSLSLNCSANSAVAVGSADWNARDGASRVWRTVNGAPMTEETYAGQTSLYFVYTGYSPDVGAAGTEVLGLTAPTAQKYSMVGVEVLGLTATAPSALPAQYVSGGVVHSAELFYWDGAARHDLNYAKQI